MSGAADADMAPAGIRDEVRRPAEIRRLTRIISRDCGPLPQPPE